MRYKHRPLALICYAPDGDGAGSGATPPDGSATGGATAGGGDPNPAGGQEPTPPMTFDQLLASNRDYQSEFDRKINQALTTAKQNWERQQVENLDEAKKLEKMTATERAQYQLDKDKAALREERATFERERLQVSVGAELQKRGLSADFAAYLTGEDADTSKGNIDRFESLWNAALSDAVNDRMRSDGPPKDPKAPATLDRNVLRHMSAEEINQNWDAVQKALCQKGR